MNGTSLLKRIGGDWRAAAPEAPWDLESKDGRRLLKEAGPAQGVRDLHGLLVRAAQLLAERTHVSRCILVVQIPRLSIGRVAREWESLRDILRPGIRDRLSLVFVGDGGRWVSDKDPELARIAAVLGSAEVSPEPPRQSAPSRKFFEVFKLLLRHRLVQGGPISIGDLVRQSGFSYPTIAETLRRLEAAGELARRSQRRVELAAFPRKTWAEVLALAVSLRTPQFYADASGRPAPPAELLKRIEKLAPTGLALGGVIAARRWDPDFDLHGTPRIDLSLHVPGRGVELGFLQKVDPALKPSPAPGLLAVHPLRRADSLYEPRKGRILPVTDPVETLLDLHELGLHAQGEALIERLTG